MKQIFSTKLQTQVLQASAYEVLQNYRLFPEMKVRTVVNLLEMSSDSRLKSEFYASSGITEIRFPIDDFSVPSSHEEIYTLALKISEALSRSHVLVHCRGGLGRTGLVLSCLYASLAKIASGDEAIAAVRSRVPHAVETFEQVEFIKSYATVHSDKDEAAFSALREVTLSKIDNLDELKSLEMR